MKVTRTCRFCNLPIEQEYEVTEAELAKCAGEAERELYRDARREQAEIQAEIMRGKHEARCEG